MKIVKWLTPFFALIAVLCFSTLASASSGTALNPRISSGTVDLLPDPSAYCIVNTPSERQPEGNNWLFTFKSVIGDPNQNNWGCNYSVWITMPATINEDGSVNFVTVPFGTHTIPIDWKNMCNQQYPGASAVWIPGPETGVDGAPWGCVGALGVIYDLAEQSDSKHQVVSGG